MMCWQKVTTKTEEDDEDKKDKDYKPHGIASKTAAGGYSRKSKRYFKEVIKHGL